MSGALANVTLVRVFCGPRAFCLAPGTISRVVPTDNLQHNPRREGPLGWMLDPDAEIPVHSLASRLRLAGGAGTSSSPVLVFTAPQGPWGLLVDRLERVAVPGSQLLPLPRLPRDEAGSPARLPVSGAVVLGEELDLLLDPARLHPAAAEDGPAPGGEPMPPAGNHRLPRPAAATSTVTGAARLLTFTAGPVRLNGRSLQLALSVTQVVEIVEPVSPTPVPGAPAFVRGLTLWRGRAVPVIDLADWLGLPAGSPHPAGRLLICRANRAGDLLALTVEPAVRLLPLPAQSRAYAGLLPFSSSRILGCFEVEQDLLAVPDLAALIP